MKTKTTTTIKILNAVAVLKGVNLTTLTPQQLLSPFQENNLQDKGIKLLEVKGIYIVIFPYKEIDIIIEASRILVNDRSGVEPKKSKLINYFKIALNSYTEKKSLQAYGFNYDVSVETNKPFNFKTLLSNKVNSLARGKRYLKSYARIAYESEKKKYDLRITPLQKNTQLSMHLNVHFQEVKINFKSLKDLLVTEYGEIQRVLRRLNI